MDVWKLLNGLAAIFEVALPNQCGMAAQLSTIFGRGLPTTTDSIEHKIIRNYIYYQGTKALAHKHGPFCPMSKFGSLSSCNVCSSFLVLKPLHLELQIPI